MATKKRKCKIPPAQTKRGKPCGAPPLKPGTEIEGVVVGGDYCRSHDPDLPDNARIQGAQPGAGRPRKISPDEVLRERIEGDIDRWLAPLEAALGAAKPLQTWDAHEGKHKIIYVADPELAMKAVKLGFDRAFGRARQKVEISGEDGGAVKTELDFADPKVREALHGLVSAVADAREG